MAISSISQQLKLKQKVWLLQVMYINWYVDHIVVYKWIISILNKNYETFIIYYSLYLFPSFELNYFKILTGLSILHISASVWLDHLLL